MTSKYNFKIFYVIIYYSMIKYIIEKVNTKNTNFASNMQLIYPAIE